MTFPTLPLVITCLGEAALQVRRYRERVLSTPDTDVMGPLPEPAGAAGAIRTWPDRMSLLALPLLEAATQAAARCYPWIGRGDKIAADHAAVEAMRDAMSSVPGSGVVVIGEGEKDDAPMLFAGEEIGDGFGPAFDLAVDPLEGTSLCAKGWPGAITVLAVAPRGTFAPLVGFYMDKLVVGPAARNVIDIDAPIERNLEAVAGALRLPVARLRVAVLAKPRHEQLIERIRAAGAGVVEIPDGDVMAGLAALLPGGGIDISVGIGGAPEGVITACAVRLLGGGMQVRMAPQSDEERQVVSDAGELGRVYPVEALAGSDHGIFVASGVTGSAALPGVKVVAEGFRVQSIIITRDHGLMRIGSTVGG